ncbi:MAG: SDR family oxidoreductase [Ectothiorhodospiraceae bacterium]|nr:SDR family oxidoreductase [Ectothiorhodospiraceae bacterium]
MARLQDKVVIITGANGGMGQEAVKIFAGEGARIVACDVAEPTPALQALIDQNNVVYVQGDLSDEALSRRVVQTALDEFGQLDVLYNNHGIMLGKPFLETEMADFDRVVDVNLRSVFALSLHAAKAMSTRRQGSIIHISSVGGIVGFPGMAAYGASKGGVAQLARSMATDLAEFNIRVNAICPGVVDTPMPRRYIKDAGAEEKETMDAMANMHLLKRNGRPEEIVWMAVYLASDESTFTTGAVIPVDGGLTAI